MLGDERNYLYKFYGEFLKRYQPKYFVFENVVGLLSAKDIHGRYYFHEMRKLFKELGYETEYRVLNAHDYGVLQARKRIILVGKRGSDTGFYPQFKDLKFLMHVLMKYLLIFLSFMQVEDLFARVRLVNILVNGCMIQE